MLSANGRALRILHIITRMVHGGAQINTLMCAVEQALRGHEVTLITGTETGPEGNLLERAHREPIRVIEVPSLIRRVNPRKDLRAFWQIFKLLGEGYDVVHTHTSKAGILGRWGAWLRRVPVVVHTPHGHVFHGYFPPLKERIYAILERCSAVVSHKLIMLTEGDLNDHVAEKIAPPDRFVVVPSGVDLEAFSPLKISPQSLGLPAGQTMVGTVLRLVPVKGIFDLLEAFAIVCRAHANCHLAIAGDGPLRAELEGRIVTLGLSQRVTMLGHVDPPGPFLQTLDLFVLPSHNEGMGRAAVEAMASGLPVVCTRIGGLPDLVEEGQNGLLVPPQSPTSLADAILRMLADPARLTEMGKISLQRSKAFSAQVMYDGLEELYAVLAARAGLRTSSSSGSRNP